VLRLTKPNPTCPESNANPQDSTPSSTSVQLSSSSKNPSPSNDDLPHPLEIIEQATKDETELSRFEPDLLKEITESSKRQNTGKSNPIR